MSDLSKYNKDIEGYDKFEGIKEKIPQLHIDALAELGNIGAGASSVALSKFLNRDVSMSLPYVKILSEESVRNNLIFKDEQFQKDEIVLVGIKAEKPNDFSLLCLMDSTSAYDLLSIIFTDITKPISIKDLSSLHLSLLKEMGSILILRYVAMLNKLLHVEVQIEKVDMCVGNLNHCLEQFGSFDDVNFGINLNIFTLEKNILFDLTILPNNDVVDGFLKAMNVL